MKSRLALSLIVNATRNRLGLSCATMRMCACFLGYCACMDHENAFGGALGRSPAALHLSFAFAPHKMRLTDEELETGTSQKLFKEAETAWYTAALAVHGTMVVEVSLGPGRLLTISTCVSLGFRPLLHDSGNTLRALFVKTRLHAWRRKNMRRFSSMSQSTRVHATAS